MLRSIYLGVLLAAGAAVLAGCPGDPPMAAFRANPSAGEAPLNVAFTDLSLPGGGDLSAWAWDFGDGATSTERNPVHLYANEGTYDVTLSVRAGRGESTVIVENAVRVGVDFKIVFVNDSAFPVSDLYIADAGAVSAGPNRLNAPMQPGARRELQPTFKKGEHIAAAVARDGDIRYTVYVEGNLNTLEFVGNRLELVLDGDTPEALTLNPR